MRPDQLLQALEQALKAQQPNLYDQHRKAGTMEALLRPILGQAEQSILDARQKAIEAATTEGSPEYVADPLRRTQVLNQAFLTAEETALNQAVEEVLSLEAE